MIGTRPNLDTVWITNYRRLICAHIHCHRLSLSHSGLEHSMPIVETHAASPMAAMPEPATWLDRHGDALYAYALMRVRDASVAEDLVQDTLLAAIRSVDRFKGESSERTWLIGILKHKVLDHWRRAGRERRLDEGILCSNPLCDNESL